MGNFCLYWDTLRRQQLRDLKMSKMLCNSNEILHHLKMGVTVMRFAEDSLPNLWTSIFCPVVIFHLESEFHSFYCKVVVRHKRNGMLPIWKLSFQIGIYHNGIWRALLAVCTKILIWQRVSKRKEITLLKFGEYSRLQDSKKLILRNTMTDCAPCKVPKMG